MQLKFPDLWKKTKPTSKRGRGLDSRTVHEMLARDQPAVPKSRVQQQDFSVGLGVSGSCVDPKKPCSRVYQFERNKNRTLDTLTEL